MNKFNLKIFGHKGILFESESELVVVPGEAGELGILAKHIPLFAALKPGKIRAKTPSGEKVFDIKEGGFVEVNREGVGIVVSDKSSVVSNC